MFRSSPCKALLDIGWVSSPMIIFQWYSILNTVIVSVIELSYRFGNWAMMYRQETLNGTSSGLLSL